MRLLVDLLLDYVFQQSGVSGRFGIHEFGGLDSGGTVEVLADLFGDSAFASLSFVCRELCVPAINKHCRHERAQIIGERRDRLCKLPSENIFVVGSWGKYFDHCSVSGNADMFEELGVVMVEDESGKDNGVKVSVWIFLEQQQVCDSFESGEK